MSKNIFTKREDLICGKIDLAEELALKYQDVELLDLLKFIREDANKMEQKLISRKRESGTFKQKIIDAFENGKYNSFPESKSKIISGEEYYNKEENLITHENDY